MPVDPFERLVHQYGKSRNLFIVTASGLVHAKADLKNALPFIIKETSDIELKTAFYQVSTSLDIEVHRLQSMLTLIHAELLPPVEEAGLSSGFQQYTIANTADGHPFERDWLLICYLLFVEAKERQAFQILLLIAHKLEDQQLLLLILQTIQDTKRSNAKFERLLKGRLS